MSKSSKGIKTVVVVLAALGTLFLILPFKGWAWIPDELQIATVWGILLLIFGATIILARGDDEGRRLSHGCAFGTLLIVVVVVVTMLAFMLDMDSWK